MCHFTKKKLGLLTFLLTAFFSSSVLYANITIGGVQFVNEARNTENKVQVEKLFQSIDSNTDLKFRFEQKVASLRVSSIRVDVDSAIRMNLGAETIFISLNSDKYKNLKERECLNTPDGFYQQLDTYSKLKQIFYPYENKYLNFAFESELNIPACNPKYKDLLDLLLSRDNILEISKNLNVAGMKNGRPSPIKKIVFNEGIYTTLLGPSLYMGADDSKAIRMALLEKNDSKLNYSLNPKERSDVGSVFYGIDSKTGNGQSLNVYAQWLDKDVGTYLLEIEVKEEINPTRKYFRLIHIPHQYASSKISEAVQAQAKEKTKLDVSTKLVSFAESNNDNPVFKVFLTSEYMKNEMAPRGGVAEFHYDEDLDRVIFFQTKSGADVPHLEAKVNYIPN